MSGNRVPAACHTTGLSPELVPVASPGDPLMGPVEASLMQPAQGAADMPSKMICRVHQGRCTV